MRGRLGFALMVTAALTACGKSREDKFREDFDDRAAELETKAKALEAEADKMLGENAVPQVADPENEPE